MMVHVGLANDGSDVVIERAEDAWRRTQSMQLSVSIARTNDDQVGDLNEGIEDYCISMERAAGRTAMVEVNVSCPNTTVGEPFTESAENLDKLFAALANNTDGIVDGIVNTTSDDGSVASAGLTLSCVTVEEVK